MANMLSPHKTRVSYAEWSEVWAHAQRIAKRYGKTATDILRESLLNRVNTELEKEGRKPLDPKVY